MNKRGNNKSFIRFVKGLGMMLILGGLLGMLFEDLIKTDEQRDREFYQEMVKTADKIQYSEFLDLMQDKKVDDVYYNTGEEYMVVTLYNDSSVDDDSYQYSVEDCRVVIYTAEEDFRRNMVMYGVNLILVRNDNTGTIALQLAISFIPLAGLIAFTMFLSSKMNSNIGEMKAEDIVQKSDVKLSDIIGLDETLTDLKIIINLISNPSSGRELGASIPHGILLSGPAGVGKTMIAKAIANEADVPFIAVNGSDFQELYVGNGARHVRQLFKIARQYPSCIIFIDEFDSLGERRDSIRSGAEDSRTINAFLKEMDGFRPLDNVFVIAATNYPDKLDDAVTRSGRFDREVKISPPRDWKVREELFKSYLKDKKLSEDVNVELLARTVGDFTGADIKTVCNEAALVAVSKDLPYITQDCLEEAIDRKVFKGSYSMRKQDPHEVEVVAYHEVGHAVMSKLLNMPISRISIKSTTSGVGGAVFHKEENSKLYTRQYLVNRAMVCYAGRAVEELKFGNKNITTGASNDITQATSIIYQIVGRNGMSDSAGILDYDMLKQAGVDADVHKIMVEMSCNLYESCLKMLKPYMSVICGIADELMGCEVLMEDEFETIFEKYTSDEKDQLG